MQEFHATAAGEYKDCPRRYYYRYVLGFEITTPQPRLFVGTGVHHALARYDMDGVAPVEAFRTWCAEQLQAHVDVPEKVLDEISLAERVLTHYDTWYNDFFRPTYKVIAVEYQVTVPLTDPEGAPVTHPETGQPVTQVSTIDALAQDKHGLLWLVERKFQKDPAPPIYLTLDEQCGLYLLAMKQAYPDVHIHGVLYQVIRKVDPARARGPIFHLTPTARAESELKPLANNRYWTWRRIVEDTVYLPRPSIDCAWKCAYKDVCVAHNQGEDPETVGRLIMSLMGGSVGTEEVG